MSSQLFRVLTDFSLPKSGDAAIAALLKPQKVEPRPPAAGVPVADPKPQPADEHAQAIGSAVQAARDEERSRARQELATALAAERQRFQDELTALRAEWARNEGAVIAARFEEAISAMEALLTRRVAGILGAFVPEAYRIQMVAELQEAIRTVASGMPSGAVLVSGPEDLLSAIRSGFGGQLDGVAFEISDAVDVTVVASDTRIETAFGPWAERLRDVLRAV
jgi:hypothetical protein